MTLPLLFAVASLAAYRLTRIVTLDTLPPLARLRARLTRRPEMGRWDGWADGLLCAWCVGFWTTGAVTLTLDLIRERGLPFPVLWWAASATVVGLIGRLEA